MPDEQQSGDQQGDQHKTVVAGVAVLIWRGDEVLVVKRAHSHGAGTWAPPGGHLEFDETFAQCAVREIREEVGVEIGEPHFVCITRDVFAEAYRSYVTVWMQAPYVSGEAQPKAKRELSEIGWFKWSELAPAALPRPAPSAGRRLLSQGRERVLRQKRG